MSRKKKKHPCDGCVYWASFAQTCDYLLIEGHRRPCPFGAGCTVRKDGRKIRVEGKT